LNRLSALEPQPVRRYERDHPGELIHLDIKKLGRIGSVGHRITGRRTGIVNHHHGIGWEFVHVCIDDASRIAFSRVLKDQKKASAIAFLKAAIAYYVSLGVKVERVMTDNGSCYRSKAFAKACKVLGLKHIFTKPYTPNASSKPACVNGPTPVPTTLRTNPPPNCRDGFIATIGIDLMVVSDPSHLSLDSA
jgi:transposase InsO family protein